ncbi:putative F-box/LRR-repeat protein isoform X2, partial [Tanacetum coccineum]
SNKVGGPYNYRWLSSNSLKRLFLKGVTVGDEALQSSCLTYSPHLETLSLQNVGYYNNYFNVHVSGRDLLSLDIGLLQENFKRNSIPFLPNIKNLRLTFNVKNDDSLLEFTNLAKACPTLETFTVKLPWTWSMPLNRRRKELQKSQRVQEKSKSSAEITEKTEDSRIPENSFEVLKILENSLEVLKVVENNLESMKLHENWSVDGLVSLFIKKFTSKAIFPRLLKSKETNF